MAPPASLVVEIKEARGLLAGDLNGLSDPFVRLTLLDGRGDVVRGSPVLQTKVRSKTLAPTWDESFTLGTRRDGVDLRVVTTLRFMVYDCDGLLRNDTLGVVDIPVDVLLPLAEDDDQSPNKTMDEWFRIAQFRPEMSKDATGELRLRFRWAAADDARAAAASGPPNLLYVTVESGRDLLPMDPDNSSDPFVKLSVVGQKFHTATVQKTLKPHWDERFAFLLADAQQTLEILVEDEDPAINDFLGRAQLVLADHVAAGAERRVEVKLLDKRLLEDKPRGSLHLRLHWLFDANAESIAASVARRNRDNSHSLAHKLTSKFGLLGPQRARNDDDDDAENGFLLPREGDENELQDASDGEDAAAAAAGEQLRFLAVSVHRVEELPPLDDVVFDKKRKNDAAVAGGGIDAYVAAWVSGCPEDFVQTRTYTCSGPREKLSTSFNETLMLVMPPAVYEDGEPMNVTLAIMDYDRLSTDDVVSHLELRDAVALAARTGGKPFWWNLYGAPVVGVADASAMDAVNAHTTAGSTYRGRLLMSVRVQQKPAARYELRHQKRGVKRLPRALLPPSRVYRLRAHFVRGVGLPVPTGKYYLTLSCGIHEITSTQKAAVGRVVEWNETEESDRLLFPVESSQIPDVIVTLCTGEWEKRIVVSYARVPAAELLAREFRDTALQWIHLRADPTTGAVKASEFPGLVMMRLALGPLESAATQIWDQRAMMEQASRRLPHQVRLRLHGLRGVGDVRSVHLAAYCGGEEIDVRGLQLSPELETSPAVVSLDVHLPLLSFSPQLLLHVKEDSKDERRVGTLAISLSDAEARKDGAPFITVCTSEQLKTNTRPQTPQPKWCPVVAASSSSSSSAEGEAVEQAAMEALVSVELIRKTIPDEVLPAPEATP
ncbi:hypothetical protein ATCC90586_008160 [Pythium insidiosum]|nr:hypothetical protein ATCC90586_008160 [Pythium insidiosum]